MTKQADDPTTSRERATHVYLAHFRVRHHELDPLGHVNNATYLNYLEQAAIDHAAAAGYAVERLRELGGVFIARRHEIEYLRPARGGDWLRVVTWPAEMSGARAFRLYEIVRLDPEALTAGPPGDALLPPTTLPTTDGDLVVRARTEWAYVDAATGRPRRIPPELIAAFITRDGK